MKRVVITGVGAITAGGLTAGALWDHVAAGRSGSAPLDLKRGEPVSAVLAAQVKGFEPARHFAHKELTKLDIVSQFAVVTAREALADSGLALTPAVAERVMCILGLCFGNVHTMDDGCHTLYNEQRARLPPMSIPRFMFHAAASQVSMALGLHGMAFVIASGCAAGTHAIGVAYQAVRSGAAEVAFTGGSESSITPYMLASWEALRVMSKDACRPFSKNRTGFVLGEGAATLVIEELSHARARGARIYAEICGFGSNADANSLTSPDPDNVARAMQLAIDDAGLTPADIGYINAHGTGTAMNDSVESGAIRKVFAGGTLPLVSSIKGATGHMLGAAGAVEAVVLAQSLQRQILPPTTNCTEKDPDIGLDVLADGARQADIEFALSNSFAFGGLNAVLAMRRYEG